MTRTSTVPASDTMLWAHWTAIGARDKVQLWEGGPYWATTNIGAENPEDYGYYFWWGDTVGYKRENGKWVATDGSSSDFLFDSSNTPTDGKTIAALQSEGWITTDGALAPEHDAAHVNWGGDWRMPTKQEIDDLNSKCDWNWATHNGIQGYVIVGKGAYASASIFLPCAGYADDGNQFEEAGLYGNYWSSNTNPSDLTYSCYFYFTLNRRDASKAARYAGLTVRPVQSFAE